MSEKTEELKPYYIRLGLDPEFKTELSNAGYFLKDLKKALNTLNTVRERKAELRTEFYETLISLRLNMKELISRLPEHQASKLKEQIKKIEKFEKDSHEERAEGRIEKYFDKNAKPLIKIVNEKDFSKIALKKLLKHENDNKDRVTVKKGINDKLEELEKKGEKEEPEEKKKEIEEKEEPAEEKEEEKSSLMDNALDDERKELEMLRKDLERIKKELNE